MCIYGNGGNLSLVSGSRDTFQTLIIREQLKIKYHSHMEKSLEFEDNFENV